jgi:hypothetical protein
MGSHRWRSRFARSQRISVVVGSVYNSRAVRRLSRLLPAVVLLASLAGCGLGQNLEFASIQLGRSIDPDGAVSANTTSFVPGDTVYVSVHTKGAGSGVIRVKWTMGTTVLGEPEKKVKYTDVAATEFHLQSAAGFPIGDYNVEVFFNGQPVASRPFHVRK